MATRVAATIEPMGDGNFPVVAANHVSGLATVATTGSYNDLLDLPSPSGSSTNSEYAEKIGKDSAHPAIGSMSLPVYVNSSGAVTPITELEISEITSDSITCPGTSITKEIQDIVSSTINLYDNWSWYLNRNCWYLSSFMTAAQYSDWQIDRAELTIKSIKYYVYTSEFAEGNLTDYCLNATSYNGTFAGAHDITTGNLISGIALQRTSANRVYIFLDSVIYPGTYEEEHTDWLDTNDNFVYSKVIIATPATVATNVVSAQDTTTKKISNISDINGKYITGAVDTSAVNIELITMKYKTTMYEDYELLCYVSSNDLHGLSYGNTISINVNGQYVSGNWYEAGTGTGFSDITTYYDYTNCRYARFSDKEICLIETNSTSGPTYLLCCTSAFMTECTNTDGFYANRAIIDTDQKLGNINIYGNLNIKKLPYYTRNWDDVPSGKLTCEKSVAVIDPNTNNSVQINSDFILVFNPNAGNLVQINSDSITIGSTTINEAQLQALLALINNPPAAATLGIMNIVE